MVLRSLIGVLALIACGGDDGAGEVANNVGASGTTAAGMVAPPPAGPGVAGQTGAVQPRPGGAGAGGSPGTSGAGGVGGKPPQGGVDAPDGGGAGGMAEAGASGMAAGGAGGAAGMAGSSSAVPGPDPTMDSASTAGTLNVESILWTDFRDGPSFSGGTIWYPTDGTPPYPFVAVVPGFVSYESSIASWGPFLASHGIVTITIDTNTTADQPPTRAAALLDALESVAAEHERSGSPLMGKLDKSRQALMGWSMGGGGTLIAANRTPTLKAAISMCGWNPTGWYAENKVPSLMFASLGDPLAGGQSQGFYATIPESTPKMLIEAGIGDHFLANNPANMSGMIGRYGLSWMKVFLQGDERYRQFLLQMPSGTTDYASNVK
jgi:dienelactone hydrolase